MKTSKKLLWLCVPLMLISLFMIATGFFRVPADQEDFFLQAQAEKIHSVQSLAGALLAQDPALESAIAASLPYSEESREYGAEVLQKYGYDSDLLLREDMRFQAIRKQWQRRVAFYCAWVVVGVISYALFLLLWTERKNRRVTAVLDGFASGEYAFATGGRRRLHPGSEGILWDALTDLGKSIQLDKRRLESEKESTKVIVTDISHQLKNPIAAIKTSFELFGEAQDEQERGMFITHCQRQIGTLEKLAQSLVNVSRLETAMIELKPTSVALEDLILDAVNAIYYKARSRNIEIQVGEFGNILLPLDKKWTTEALVNVLDNAVKYSDEGSRILLSAEHRIDFVRIEVRDFGIGIPRGEFTEVFKRFYRGEHRKVQASEGAGVGLYLTRMILEKQGGSISIRNTHGGGATFVIQLRKTVSKL